MAVSTVSSLGGALKRMFFVGSGNCNVFIRPSHGTLAVHTLQLSLRAHSSDLSNAISKDGVAREFTQRYYMFYLSWTNKNILKNNPVFEENGSKTQIQVRLHCEAEL